MLHTLSRPFPTRWGAPVIDRVDDGIFIHRYFVKCMECSYCFDACCQHGVDVDAPNVARIEAHRVPLEQLTGIPSARWFTGEWNQDADFPGGQHTRTRDEGGACVFRSRVGRGCLLHKFALDSGIDYHQLKPMVSALFPLTFDGGLLRPSNMILDKSLVCVDDGPTVYEGVRGEVEWYFGRELVEELDARLQSIQLSTMNK